MSSPIRQEAGGKREVFMKKINKYVDVVSGIFWIVVAVVMYVLSLQIVQRASTEGTVGPAFMPRLAAILIIVTGALVTVKGMSDIKKGAGETGSFPEEGKVIVTVLVTAAVTIAYVALLETLGFVLATVMFLFTILSYFDLTWKKHIVRNALIAVVVAALTYALFRYVFSLTLPIGRIF